MKNVTFPYGMCECPQASGLCCGGIGPAAFDVTRKGQRLRLCTKCDMPKDEEKVLLVQESDDSDLFARFDALGFFCIMGRLQEAREAKAESTKGA